MAKLLVLEIIQLVDERDSGEFSAYRGIVRPGYTYVDALPLTHPVNQAVVETSFTDGYIRDLTAARSLVRLYGELLSPLTTSLEIIEITGIGEHPAYAGKLLGIDVLFRPESLTALYILFDAPQSQPLPYFHTLPFDSELEITANTLKKLLIACFREKLNVNRLFTSIEDAQFYVACLYALERLMPNAIYSDLMADNTFEIYQVWLIS